jgi:intracellular septation protein
MTFESAPNEPHTPAEKKLNPWLKLGLELGPLLIFFLANARGEQLAERFPAIAALGGPIFFATASFIVTTVAALVVSFALTRRLPLTFLFALSQMPLITRHSLPEETGS